MPLPAVADDANPALLVVNNDYANIAKLPTTINDGNRLAEVLRGKPASPDDKRRFSPDLKPIANLNRADFETRWEQFRDQILAMRSDGVAVFYYSGHGVEIDNDSYLVPVDVPADASEAQLRGMSVGLRKLFRDFRGWQEILATNHAVKVNGIFIIDACREVPLKSPEIVTKSTKGFAPAVANPVAPPSSASGNRAGMIVLYAASAGQVAHTVTDGTRPEDIGDRPSVYTRHLSRLLQEGLAVQTSANRVRWEVHKEVAAAGLKPQTPAFYDELLESIDVWGKEPSVAERPSDPITIRRPVERGEPVWECENCPHLVVVPPGQFKMGSRRGEQGRDSSEEVPGAQEQPWFAQRFVSISSSKPSNEDYRLPVSIAHTFAIGTREVTRGEFQSFLIATSKDRKSCPPDHTVCAKGESLNRPVTNVSWRDVQGYIAWLNSHLGLDPAKPEKGFYRLPTEAEWEYAARGGVESRFVSGDDASKLCLYGNGADQSLNTMSLLSANNTCNDGKGRDVADVQSYKPNGFGLYDVHGNAWEWVQDCWSDRLGTEKKDGGAYDPPASANSCPRVARGGSWRSAPEALRLAKRVAFPVDHRRVTLGFRVARTLADGELALPGSGKPIPAK